MASWLRFELVSGLMLLLTMLPLGMLLNVLLDEVAAQFGLIVSVPKTKGIVMSNHCTPADLLSVQLEGGQVEVVEEFPSLGSIII